MAAVLPSSPLHIRSAVVLLLQEMHLDPLLQHLLVMVSSTIVLESTVMPIIINYIWYICPPLYNPITLTIHA